MAEWDRWIILNKIDCSKAWPSEPTGTGTNQESALLWGEELILFSK